MDCGYSACLSALEFHHRDPKEKDFGISRHKYLNREETKQKLRIELDKCDLICSNCHRERHAKQAFMV